MAIRLTGMMSGLDTDTIIKELVSAQSLKKTKVLNKKTKLEWTMDKWKTLNTKIYGLYTGSLNKLKTQGNYQAKKVTSSNENFVTATAKTSAMAGSHTVEVKNLASGQYVTGKKLTNPATNNSKLTDFGFGKGEKVDITVGKDNAKTTSLVVGENTTIKDFVKTLQSAGLNANFDEGQQRFFISSKESGLENQFTISSVKEDTGLAGARENLLNAVGKGNESVVNDFFNNYAQATKERNEKEEAYKKVMAGTATPEEKVKAYDEWQNSIKKVNSLVDNLASVAEKNKEAELNKTANDKVAEKYSEDLKNGIYPDVLKEITDAADKLYYKYDENGKTNDYTEDVLKTAESTIETELRNEALKEINDGIANGIVYPSDEARQQAIEAKYQELYNAKMGNDTLKNQAIQDKAKELYDKAVENGITSAGKGYLATDDGKNAVNDYLNNTLDKDNAIAQVGSDVRTAVTNYDTVLNNPTTPGATDSYAGLTQIGLGKVTETGVFDETGNASAGVSFEQAKDAKITFDGAELTSSNNSITVSDITLDLKGVTTDKVTINVASNTTNTYDMIKDFVKQYNSVLTEMNTAFYAGSAKGYEPLTSEQKEAMTEEDIKNWETKIQSSLLRRDQTLGGIMSTMRTALQTSVVVDGKTYSLSSFGITTSSDWTEKGLLHIQGDSEDTVYAGSANKLQKALEEDPELVGKVLSGIADKLYGKLQDKMGTSTLSSALTFYNDKQMNKQIDAYKEDLKKWETKLQVMEDRYYKQFGAMEKALAKLNAQSSSLGGLLGM